MLDVKKKITKAPKVTVFNLHILKGVYPVFTGQLLEQAGARPVHALQPDEQPVLRTCVQCATPILQELVPRV